MPGQFPSDRVMEELVADELVGDLLDKLAIAMSSARALVSSILFYDSIGKSMKLSVVFLCSKWLPINAFYRWDF